MKTGLVLEGGGMRGVYSAGVLDVLMENNIEADGVIGVSAGSIHGASYVSNQPERNIRYTAKYSSDWHFMSFRSLLLTGDIVGKEFGYHEIPYHLDPFDFSAFFQSDKEFYAVATNVETGKAEYLDAKAAYREKKAECEKAGIEFDEEKQREAEQNCLDILRASSSLPLVSNIVEINGMKLLDGGTSDSIPIHEFRKMGYKKNIVVLTRPAGYRKEKEKMIHLIAAKYREYPEYVIMAAKRHLKYNRTLKYLEDLEKIGEVFVIRPSREIHISRIEKDESVIHSQYQLGKEDASKLLDKLKEYL